MFKLNTVPSRMSKSLILVCAYVFGFLNFLSLKSVASQQLLDDLYVKSLSKTNILDNEKMLAKLEKISKVSNKKSDVFLNDENSTQQVETDQPKLF